MAIIPIFIPHAGCPHQCVFCNQKTISGQKLAAVEAAQQQIERWLQWVRPSRSNEAAFYGGTFTALGLTLQQRLLALTDALLERGIIGSVRLSTRPDYIDVERLELLLQHQVRLVELGVQSLDDAVLEAAGRGHDAAAVYRAHGLLRRYGLQTGLQLMVGLPRQSLASVRETAAQAAALRPDVARIYPLLVIRNTPLARDYAEGRFRPLSLEEATEQSALLYRELTAAGVKIIRMGLQADAELCAPGNILAGPFHPSLGELVKSRVLRDRLTPELRLLAERGEREALVYCPPRLESQLRGLKNANLHYWQQLFPQLLLRIIPCEREEVSLCRNAAPLRP